MALVWVHQDLVWSAGRTLPVTGGHPPGERGQAAVEGEDLGLGENGKESPILLLIKKAPQCVMYKWTWVREKGK